MSLNIGRKGWAKVGLQSGAGVPATGGDYVPFETNDLHGMQDQLQIKSAYGNRETVFSSIKGLQHSEGAFEGLLDSNLFGYFAIGAMGTVNDTSQGGGVYLHTVTRNNSNTPQYLSIINDRVVDREAFYDVAVDELDISVGTDLAMYKTKLIGNFPQTTTSGTNTTASGNVMSFRNAQFAFGSSVSAAQSATNLKPHDFQLNIKNNVEAVPAHGSGTPRSINSKGFDITGTFQLYFENTTDRDAYYAQSKQSGSLQFIGNGIGGGYNEMVRFNFYQLSINTFELETGLDNYYAEKVTLQGEYDNANSESVDIEIQNTKASY